MNFLCFELRTNHFVVLFLGICLLNRHICLSLLYSPFFSNNTKTFIWYIYSPPRFLSEVLSFSNDIKFPASRFSLLFPSLFQITRRKQTDLLQLIFTRKSSISLTRNQDTMSYKLCDDIIQHTLKAHDSGDKPQEIHAQLSSSATNVLRSLPSSNAF